MDDRQNQQTGELYQKKKTAINTSGKKKTGPSVSGADTFGNAVPGYKDLWSKKTQEKNSWVDHPDLAGMDAAKLAMLNTLAQQGAGKSPSELLPFLMSAASQNRSRGLRFSSQEMDTIIQVLKIGRSPEEIARMEKIIQMMKLLH